MLRALDVTYFLSDEEYDQLCQITEECREFGFTMTPEEKFNGIMATVRGSVKRALSDYEEILGMLKEAAREEKVPDMEKEHSAEARAPYTHPYCTSSGVRNQ